MSAERRPTLAEALGSLEACLRELERKLDRLFQLYLGILLVQALALVLLLAMWWGG